MQTDEVQVMPLSQPLAPQTSDLSMQEQADPPPLGVFWSLPSSADIGCTDKEIEDKCIAVGIQVPNFERMNPWARHRLPTNPDMDSYKPLALRTSDKDWHKNHGPPKDGPELAEDAAYMMRMLHRNLPLLLITKQTKASKNAEQFARNYGVKFSSFARERNAIHVVDGIERICKDRIREALINWLRSKVWATGNSFQWDGFVMSADEITRTTEMAVSDWLNGWV
jgi:hypothetical protein